MAISVLLIGIVIGRVGKTPAFLNFKDCVTSIENVFNEAATRAETTGKKIVVIYRNRKFSPYGLKLAYSNYNYMTYTVPKAVFIKFSNQSDTIPKFTFFPSGLTSGPSIKLVLHGHIAVIRISKLTGLPIVKTND
ncbi:MAG: hypothetical protein GY756_16365 [bacterium]|nr:hypothetical protein [bacterium]